MKTCTVEANGVRCERQHQAKGLCMMHYVRQRQGIPLDAPVKHRRPGVRRKGMCTFPSCGRKAHRQGLCQCHYLRSRVAPERMSLPIIERRQLNHHLAIPREVYEGAIVEKERRAIPGTAPILREWLRAGYEAWVEARRQESLQRHDFGRQRNSGPRRSA